MGNYEQSNSILEYKKKYKIKAKTKRLFNSLYGGDTITQFDLNKLSDAICGDFGVLEIPISFGGKQPKSKRSVTKGNYSYRMLGDKHIPLGIRVYKLTATRKQEITNKVAIDILLHELTHYFDYKIIGLSKSIHSKGFYTRISYLKSLLQ